MVGFLEEARLFITMAKNYRYKEGELDRVIDKKFEKATITQDFSDFPNITYFLKKKQLEKQEIPSLIEKSQLLITENDQKIK